MVWGILSSSCPISSFSAVVGSLPFDVGIFSCFAAGVTLLVAVVTFAVAVATLAAAVVPLPVVVVILPVEVDHGTVGFSGSFSSDDIDMVNAKTRSSQSTFIQQINLHDRW